MKVVVLPGDCIGPEIASEARRARNDAFTDTEADLSSPFMVDDVQAAEMTFSEMAEGIVFEAEMPLDEGLRRTVESYRQGLGASAEAGVGVPDARA